MARKKKIEEKVKEIKKKLDLNLVDSFLQDNVIEFEFNNCKYRVRKPTFKERQTIYEKKIEKYNELLEKTDDKGRFMYKTEDEIKELYKKRGVDIDDFDKQHMALEKQKQTYQEKLGEALKNKKSDKELQVYKEEIEKITEKQTELSIKKAKLLENSIESQVLMFVYSYLAFLVTEKLENDKWIKAFKNYDEFLNQPEDLVNACIYYTTLIAMPETDIPLL